MLIGVPKEIKTHEYRVGLVPASVRELIHHGHKVLVQTGAGAGIGFDDKAYTAAGAKIAASAEDVFAKAEMIVKVKEPQPKECKMLREGQLLFTYLHLAPDPEQTKALLKSGCTAIAYETVTNARGGLPLLAPMSEVAGRMSIQVGAHCLEKAAGGSGILLGGVPGVPPARVVVLGGGVSGTHAARMAMGMEANVMVIDKSLDRLKQLDEQFGSKLYTQYATVDAIESNVHQGRPGDRRRAGAGRRGAEAGDQGHAEEDAAGLGAGGHLHRPGRLLRDQPCRPPTPSRPSWWTASCITASPTCRVRWRAPPPSRSTTPPCPSRSPWRTRATAAPAPRMRICAMASMFTRAS